MSNSERRLTDESLRIERERADTDVQEKLAAINETADAVINRARARADEVLARARAQSDATSDTPIPLQSTEAIDRERTREDELLRTERANADETVRIERAMQVARLSTERVDTDHDLLSERAYADGALATRDEFLGIVSHDLRNMLNGMVGFAALIERESRNGRVADLAQYAQRIQRSGARMDRLIGDLVDVASIEAGRLAVTLAVGDPSGVVMEAVESFQAQASARRLTLVTEIESPPLVAAFDSARILQVLVNLLSNAIKFTPSPGTVVVRLERIGNELRFTFRDTGVGIPADKLKAVFERFTQVTKNDRRGLGLGLYISQCIVHGHGGRIWAESEIGVGSTLSFTLPVLK